MKSPQRILIWDKDGLPKPSNHFVVFWKNYSQNLSDQELSIPAWIAKNQEFVRHQYLTWVQKSYQTFKNNSGLYEKLQHDSSINYFQLTPFMEMNLFAKSPHIYSILRLIAFEACSEEMTLISIDYEGDDELLSKAFQVFAARCQIPFGSSISLVQDARLLQNIRHMNKLIGSATTSLVWIFLKWVKSLPLHGLNLKRWKLDIENFTFYSYYAHFPPTNVFKSEFKSAYWGELPKYIKSIGKHSNWVHLNPSNDGFLAALDERSNLKKWSGVGKCQTHVALESFFSFRIMIRTILSWHRIRSHAPAIQHYLASQRSSNFDIWPFYASEFERYLSGVGLIDNLLTYELIKSSIQTSSASKQTFYLYEGQPWEKVLNSVSVCLNRELPVAVQHSTVRFWDLRYFQHLLELPERDEMEGHFPKKIVVNGELSFRMLGKRPAQQELIILESLRYRRSPSIQREFLDTSEKVSPVILGSFLPEDDEYILELLEEIAPELANIEFTFKPHPLATKPFLSKSVAINSSSQELWPLLQGATHVLIGSSTSAVLEVIEAKIPFAVFLPPSTVNLSPLNGVAGVEFLANSIQLLNFLAKNRQEFLNGLNVEDLITAHANLDLWKHFLRKSK